MGIVLVWLRDEISKPLEGIVGLFVISKSSLALSLLDDGSEQVPRSGVAFPYGPKFRYEVLRDGTKPGMEESEFCRGEKNVSRVLCRVSEWAGPVSFCFIAPYVGAYLDPLFILV